MLPSLPENTPIPKYAIATYTPEEEEPSTLPNGRRGTFLVNKFSLEYEEVPSEDDPPPPPNLKATTSTTEKKLSVFNLTGSGISSGSRCKCDYNYQLGEWIVIGTVAGEIAGELALTESGIAAIQAVSFAGLSDAVKEILDPEGILAAMTKPRVFKLGKGSAHSYRIYRVNTADTGEPASYEYFAVPLYSGLPTNPTKITTTVVNMSATIASNYLLQAKSIGSPATEPEESQGGFGETGDPSNTSTIESVVSGVIDVVACSPAPAAI